MTQRMLDRWLELYRDRVRMAEHWRDKEDAALDKGNEEKAARCERRAEEFECEATGMRRALEIFGYTVDGRYDEDQHQVVLGVHEKT